MPYLLYPLLICLLLVFINYFIIFLQLLQAKFQYPKYRVINPEQVPGYFQDLLQTPIRELQQIGFQPCSYLEYQPMIVTYEKFHWELLLYNKQCRTYATIVINRQIEPVNLFDIEFYTFFKDQTLLLTVNGKLHGFIGEIPRTMVQDIYAHNIASQWSYHHNKLQQLNTEKSACALLPASFAQALQIFLGNYVKSLAHTGQILPIKETKLFQLHWLTAIKTVQPIVQGGKKVRDIHQQRRKQAKVNPNLHTAIPVELEVAAFQHMQHTQQGLLSKPMRTWLFLVSIVVFAASSAHFLNWQSVLIFIAVLLFHEGGHILAMKLFGYQDTSILFVPFLGALATGHKHEATLSQKFWISLAGPLPGLILGIILAILTPHTGMSWAWLQKTNWILIFVNLFNLLPIYPLDGGKIANLLLFSRLPFADVGFKLIGVVIFFLLGKQEPGLLLFLMLVVLSIPNDFRNAQVSGRLQKELGAASRQEQQVLQSQIKAVSTTQPWNSDDLLPAIFKYLQQWGYGNLPFQTKYALVKDLMQRHYESSGKWTTRIMLLTCYGLSLLGGVVGGLQATIPGWMNILPYFLETPQQRYERFTHKRQGEIASLTAALRANPNDVKAYKHRARLRMMSHDQDGALADYNQVIRLTPNDLSARMIRARIRTSLLDYQGAIQDYDEVVRLKPQDFTVYERRAQVRNLMQDYKGAIADYNQIIQLKPQNTWVYVLRGEARQKIQDYQGALADAEFVIQQNPQHIEAYVLRGAVRRSLGDTKGAIADQQLADRLLQAISKNEP